MLQSMENKAPGHKNMTSCSCYPSGPNMHEAGKILQELSAGTLEAYWGLSADPHPSVKWLLEYNRYLIYIQQILNNGVVFLHRYFGFNQFPTRFKEKISRFYLPLPSQRTSLPTPSRLTHLD